MHTLRDTHHTQTLGIMEMNKTIFLVLFFFSTQVKAQNNFEPCSDIFSQPLWLSENYMRTASDLMSQADSFHVEASILTDHSLTSSDNILELVQNYKTKEYKLVFRESRIDTGDIDISHHKKNVSHEFAVCMKELFVVALIHVEYQPTKSQYTDGIHYHLRSDFWGVQNRLCGYTRTPTSNKVLQFLQMINRIIDFTTSSMSQPPPGLIEEMKSLTKMFNEKELNLDSPTIEEIMDEKEFKFFK